MEHVTDDLILISRDGDFKDYSTFLIDEYRSKTEKSLFIVETLSEALKYVGEEPSDKLVQFEEEQKKRILYMATDLSDTLEGLNSLARAIDRSHIAGLSSLVEEANKSYMASLGSIDEATERWNSLARAMDISPFMRQSDMVERLLDSPSRNLNYLSTGYDSETSEWLEGDVNENQEESAPDESSQKKDYTIEETQVETKADKDIEQ